ncbi:protein NO VEIN domain-containing protein, partial [Neoasaia chiangmaiensis]|uniref:protein NO VEIN domain-containing protein n=1 Tax=Neoasaia chiangmaiensis TaxID=320497 RepID=UPI003570C141
MELGSPAQLHGVEVKSAVPATAGRIILSRNEYEVAQRMGGRWKMTQVIFSSKVVATRSATKADVEA